MTGELFRVRLRLRSRLVTPLAADTLWGHLAWGIRYSRGIEALTAWLARYDAGTPPVVLSDPLPAGCFPRPLLPEPVPAGGRPTEHQQDALKRAAKVAWIHEDVWPDLARGLDYGALTRTISGSPSLAASTMAGLTHAGIHRFTGGTATDEGGLLYTAPQSFAAPGAELFDVWTWTADGMDELRRLFEDGLAGGYGRDAATGAGHLTLEAIEADALPAPPQPNAAVLLGPAVPAPADPARGYFRLQVKVGRVGGDYAIEAGTGRVKRPVTMLQRGSVVIGTTERPWMGRVLGGVHDNPAIRHYGMTLLLPCRLDTRLLKDVA